MDNLKGATTIILPKKSLYLFVILCGFAGIVSGLAGTDASQTRVSGKKLPPNATNGQVKGIPNFNDSGKNIEEAAGRLGLASYRALTEDGWRTLVELQ